MKQGILINEFDLVTENLFADYSTKMEMIEGRIGVANNLKIFDLLTEKIDENKLNDSLGKLLATLNLTINISQAKNFYCLYIFDDIQYIKGVLSKYAISFRQILVGLLIEMISDKKRFPYKFSSLDYIIEELKKYDCKKTFNSFSSIAINDHTFFGGSNEITFDTDRYGILHTPAWEKHTKRWFYATNCIWGFESTTEEKHLNYLSAHNNPELHTALQKVFPNFISQNSMPTNNSSVFADSFYCLLDLNEVINSYAIEPLRMVEKIKITR